MTMLNFPASMRFIVLQTGVVARLGHLLLDAATNLELAQVSLRLLKVGQQGGSESMTLRLYPTSGYDSDGPAIYSSTAHTLASVSGIPTTTACFYMTIPFSFSRPQLMASTRYYVGLSAASYTRNADTYYLAVKTAWPDVVVGQQYDAADLRVIGYK